jgi:hypothetical protein
MPVYKKAARPTVAYAPDDPRSPQPSDNDLTVLFRRMPSFKARQIARPKPAPKPPISARTVDTGRHDRVTPMGMALPADDIETVAVQPRLRQRVLQVVAFVAVGCTLGIGVEAIVRPHGPLHSSGAEPSQLIAATAQGATNGPDEGRSQGGAAVSISSDRSPARATHHHHARPSAPAAAPATASARGASGADAGEEGDDLSAAMQTLSKAKEEMTLP